VYPYYEKMYTGPIKTRTHIGDRRAAHNSFLEVAAELGPLGIALLGAIIWRTLTHLRAAREHCTWSDSTDESFVEWFSVAFLGYVIAGNSLNIEESKFLWILIGLALAMRRSEDERCP
jgi:O-antigen ligase